MAFFGALWYPFYESAKGSDHMAIRESSFRFGCGRYLEEPGALSLVGGEAIRYGKRALIIGGRTALLKTGERIACSLSEAGVAHETICHKGTCNREDAALYAERAKAFDLVIGVGGGVVMDLAKLVAIYAERPLINVPTSAATCAAFTPLSVCYTREGKTVGTVHHKTEVQGVVVDTEVILQAPPRLLVAGIFDALAKYTELRHRYRDEEMTGIPLGLDYAYHLAKCSYDFLFGNAEGILECVKSGEVTELFERAVFSLIAVTGIISSIARGSNQTALAHKFYETARRMHTSETAPYLHGELVGVGLLLQNLYNGTEGENEKLSRLMARYGLPMSPRGCGLPIVPAVRAEYEEALLAYPAMQEGGDPARLSLAMDAFWIM